MNTQVNASLNDTQAQPMDIANTQVNTALNDTPNTEVDTDLFLGQLMPYHTEFLNRVIPGTGLYPSYYMNNCEQLFEKKTPLEIACFGLVLDYYEDNRNIWNEIWKKTHSNTLPFRKLHFVNLASLIACYFYQEKNIEMATTYEQLRNRFPFNNPIKQIINYANWWKLYTKGLKIPKEIKDDFLSGWRFGSWYNRRSKSHLYNDKDIIIFDYEKYDLNTYNYPDDFDDLPDDFEPMNMSLLIVLDK